MEINLYLNSFCSWQPASESQQTINDIRVALVKTVFDLVNLFIIFERGKKQNYATNMCIFPK